MFGGRFCFGAAGWLVGVRKNVCQIDGDINEEAANIRKKCSRCRTDIGALMERT